MDAVTLAAAKAFANRTFGRRETAWKRPDYDDVYRGVTCTAPALIALRFDDCPSIDLSIIAGLWSRGLVATFAANEGTLDTAGHITTAQLKTGHDQGNEVANHSKSHAFSPASYAAFKKEIDDNHAYLLANNMHPDLFIQPGTWNATRGNFQTFDDLDTDEGRYLQSIYAGIEAYVERDGIPSKSGSFTGYIKPWPRQQRMGVLHTEITTWTPTALTTLLADLTDLGGFIEVMVHGAHLSDSGSDPGNLSLAQLLAFFDQLVTYRDAGKLEVLTATAARRAVPSGTHQNLLADGSFELSADGAVRFWIRGSTGVMPSILTSGGHSGAHAVQVTAANSIRQNFLAYNCRSVMFDGWARSATPGTPCIPQLRMYCDDTSSGTHVGTGTQYNNVTTTYSADGWTHIRRPFRMDPRANEMMVWLQASGTPDVIWDDISLYKV